jgi:LemA protein
MAALITLVALALLLLFWSVGAYKRLVSLRNQFKKAFAQLDMQLKRRHDLVPDLVETAGAYMNHERDALEQVIATRNQAVKANAAAVLDPADADPMQQMAAAEAALTASLGTMMALSQAYPALKADQNIAQSTEELASTENRIAFALQGYNDEAVLYNTSLEQFPSSLIAFLFAFSPAVLLQAAEPQQQSNVMEASS